MSSYSTQTMPVPEAGSGGTSPSQHTFLQDVKLTRAERRYLASIASLYDTSQMKASKQDQYRALLRRQLKLGESLKLHSPMAYGPLHYLVIHTPD